MTIEITAADRAAEQCRVTQEEIMRWLEHATPEEFARWCDLTAMLPVVRRDAVASRASILNVANAISYRRKRRMMRAKRKEAQCHRING